MGEALGHAHAYPSRVASRRQRAQRRLKLGAAGGLTRQRSNIGFRSKVQSATESAAAARRWLVAFLAQIVVQHALGQLAQREEQLQGGIDVHRSPCLRDR